MSWIDLTEELTAEAFESLNIGEVLMFTFEGSPLHIKIMRKTKDKIWGKVTYLYTPEEFEKEGAKILEAERLKNES